MNVQPLVFSDAWIPSVTPFPTGQVRTVGRFRPSASSLSRDLPPSLVQAYSFLASACSYEVQVGCYLLLFYYCSWFIDSRVSLLLVPRLRSSTVCGFRYTLPWLTPPDGYAGIPGVFHSCPTLLTRYLWIDLWTDFATSSIAGRWCAVNYM